MIKTQAGYPEPLPHVPNEWKADPPAPNLLARLFRGRAHCWHVDKQYQKARQMVCCHCGRKIVQNWQSRKVQVKGHGIYYEAEYWDWRPLLPERGCPGAKPMTGEVTP